jgi:hypothetical protein
MPYAEIRRKTNTTNRNPIAFFPELNSPNLPKLRSLNLIDSPIRTTQSNPNSMNESNGMPSKKVCGIVGTIKHNKISAAISEYDQLTDRGLELNIATKSYLKFLF